MAKKVMKAIKKVVRKVKSGVKTIASNSTIAQARALDLPALKAERMLADPCNSELAPGCYRGDQGQKVRLVANFSEGTAAGITCVVLGFIPNSGTLFSLNVAASGTAAAYTNRGVVGNTFLTTNANAMRSLGACVSVTPNSANLSTSGQVYAANIPASALALLAATDSPDAVSQLCNQYGKIIIDGPMECKFVPSGADEDYTTPGQLGDASDTNVIVMVFVGLPAASGINLRITNIVDWKPKSSLGIVTESFLGNPSRNTIEHVKQSLRSKNPHWYTNVGGMAYSVIRGYATGGMMGATGAAMRSVKNFM